MKEPTLFDKFYKEFGRNMVLGCYEDEDNRSKVAKLLRFSSSKLQQQQQQQQQLPHQQQISLEEYVARMQPGQQAIYYAAGEDPQQLLKLPQMQHFLKKDVEVLFLLEAMDEPCIQRLMEFDGKKFESVQKGEVHLEETAAERARLSAQEKFFKPLKVFFKRVLGSRVSQVRVSGRLLGAPCAVAASQWGYSAQMEKVMKTQTFADPLHLKMMKGQKVFEINPNHRIMQQLLARQQQQQQQQEGEQQQQLQQQQREDEQLAEKLFEAALLASGFDVDKPDELADLLYKSFAAELGVDPNDPINENFEIPEDPEPDSSSSSSSSSEEGGAADDLLSSFDFGENVKDEL
ncbi:heat shock protein 90, putative [Eimeria tenella]|uniref:Heat shock protein 90, putative n=1 Tax=Eimeria tenella TaxID=5802 RepID=U6L493_EIMTE|nr:heat shock protein 90, putative [Eimeria tenella]CDJ45237.1 heat shock protein 90, putative [Eimeria tenella]|eukprot:XP_013235984.1 heat shock protein 90, putative [Eimeria tenella]